MKNKPRVYIDSCCFIDIVKLGNNVTLAPDRQNDVWFLQRFLEAHRDGWITVHTSILAVGECLAIEAGQANVPPKVQEQFRSLLTSGQFVQLLNPTPKTTTQMQQFRWQHNLVLGGADAIHFASALEIGCAEFITTDERLQKEKVKKASSVMSTLGMNVVTASKTLILPDHYRQTDMVPQRPN